MLVVGGRNSVTGAVAGTVIVTGLTETTRILSGPDFNPGPFDFVIRPGLTDICLGLAMLGFMILRPNGLLHDREVTDLPGLRRLNRLQGVFAPAGPIPNTPTGSDGEPAPTEDSSSITRC